MEAVCEEAQVCQAADLLHQEALAGCHCCCHLCLLHCIFWVSFGHHQLSQVQVEVDCPLCKAAPVTAQKTQHWEGQASPHGRQC